MCHCYSQQFIYSLTASFNFPFSVNLRSMWFSLLRTFESKWFGLHLLNKDEWRNGTDPSLSPWNISHFSFNLIFLFKFKRDIIVLYVVHSFLCGFYSYLWYDYELSNMRRIVKYMVQSKYLLLIIQCNTSTITWCNY